MYLFRSDSFLVVFPPRRLSSLWSFFVVLLATPLLARDIKVSSIPELRAALSNASPGDRILVADGEYSTASPLEITSVGTRLQPIEIVAQTVGGVELKGIAGFTFASPAAYVTLRGFKFTH